MATFTFIDAFKDFQGACVPDMDFANDQFTIYLSDEAPIVATDSPKTDIANITEQNGYTETNLTTTWVETAGGSGIFVLRHNADVVWTASGGSFGPFRYAVVYNNTITTPLDLLVGFWDNGSSITITVGNSFTVDLNATFDIFSLDG
jgi:hypothetical protein